MEQLFGLVNTLLQDHPETRKRRLSIRTYKVCSTRRILCLALSLHPLFLHRLTHKRVTAATKWAGYIELMHCFFFQVVPFTPSAGVLEWVNGTIPLGEYLLGG